jgi:DNA-binding NarL/FixJ family response regulator
MRFPQIVVCAFDTWAANQLRELAAGHRWLLREVRQPAAALELARQPRPTVLVVQADPSADRPNPLRLVADTRRLAPDAATVVLSDVKLSDDDRAAWTATVLDLGARYVLFPPVQRSVLEDLVGGLMAATLRRVVGPEAAGATIDLADERYEDD